MKIWRSPELENTIVRVLQKVAASVPCFIVSFTAQSIECHFQKFCDKLCWCFWKTGLQCKASEGFLRNMFNPGTNFIQLLFIQHLVYCFESSSSNNPVCLYLQFYATSSMWNYKILEFIPECSPYFQCKTTFRTGTEHKWSLFQCVSHTWNFNTEDNTTE